LLLLALILLIPAYFPHYFHFFTVEKQYHQFLQNLQEKSKYAQNQLEQLKKWEEGDKLNKFPDELASNFSEKKISYFIVRSGKLAFWSENNSRVENLNDFTSDQAFYQSDISFYKKEILQQNSTSYIALIHLYHKYPIENNYLQKGFVKDFQFPAIKGIGIESTDYPIIDKTEKSDTFYLLADKDEVIPIEALIFNSLFWLGILIMLQCIFQFAPSNQIKRSIFFISWVLMIRILIFFFLPETLSESSFFQSQKMAFSDFIPSIGDLLLHLITLLIIAYQTNLIFSQSRHFLPAFLQLFLGYFFAFLSIELIQSSISSSQIAFNLSNLFNLSIYSLISLICFCLLFMITIMFFHPALKQISRYKNSIPFLSASAIVYAALISFTKPKELLVYLWCIPLIFILNIYFFGGERKKITVSILFLILCSATIAFWINHEIETKKSTQAKNLLIKLAEDRDPIAEYLFNEVQDSISTDLYVQKNLGNYWSEKDRIDNYLHQNYFNNYWNRYNINLSICRASDYLYLSGQEQSISCFNYFKDRIRSEGSMVSSNNLFQLQNLAGRIDYIGEIPLKTDSVSYQLFVEFSANYFNQFEGYPELLLDRNSKLDKPDLSNYSYAVYHRGTLLFHNGNFTYSVIPKFSELASEEFYRYQTENYNHTAYQKHHNTLIVLSFRGSSLIDFLTAFTYLLIIFSLLFFLFSISLKGFYFHFSPNINDYSVKIQIFIIASLLMALIFVGISSSYYIKKQFQTKNISNLKEKIRSIRLEFESKIGNEELLSADEQFKNYLSGQLIQLSNVFYTDINFYDLNGELYLSSRAEIFEKGLKSRRMQPTAFQNVAQFKKSEWVQEERIGEMEYLSAYIPFMNYENKVIAYLNLPYFVKQGKLEEEISNFLVSVTNIYVGIFVLSIFISLLLINQLSRPLHLIREKISRLKLGSSIELIEWKSEDEIGALVNEYNRIAIELNDSAEQLAKKERESAWREMAKQVAHEIKNPLTPMKLSIQHLQIASKSKSADLNDRIKKTADTLIQQIDSLNHIASAFSAFAKFPEKNLSRIDLIPILKNIISLYSSDAKITFQQNIKLKEAYILADKDQLLRTLNNIIKNAIQATHEKGNPLIEISLAQVKNHYVLSIKDNGIGIEKDKLEKIFEPNFTTKSSGTGLGLALAKNSVEQMHGKIEVKTKVGEWTTFIIHFPIA